MTDTPADPRAEILARIAAARPAEAPDMPAPAPASPAGRARSRRATPSAESSQTGGAPPQGPEKGGAAADGEPEGWDLACARLPTTDLGNAQRFVLRHGDRFLYVPEWGWLAWDGRRWSRERAGGLLNRAVHATVMAIGAESFALADSGEDFEVDRKRNDVVFQSDRLQAWALASQSNAHVSCIERLAAPYLEARVADFDTDPMVFNARNGTLRFRVCPDGGDTVTFCAHDPADRITRLAEVDYLPEAACPVYDAFLARVQPDPQMHRHLHAWGGVSLTGDTSLQKLAFWYGKGRNGKSTLLNSWAHVAGDYAATIPIESFLDQGRSRRGGEPTPDLAALVGVRMLTTSEGERGAKIAEALIKTVTGEEKIRVRELNSPFFDLAVQFTLTMFGNYKPTISGTDDGIWARVVFVPWMVRIPDSEIDRELGGKLRAEASGILNRLLDGIRDFLDNGLTLPDEVADATAAFRVEQDPLGRFLEDCIEFREGARVQATELHKLFQAWCVANGEKAWTPQGLGRALAERGYRSKRSNVMWWVDMAAIRDGHNLVENFDLDPKNWRPKVIADDGGGG